MPQLLLNKLILSTLSSLSFIILLAIGSPNVQADVTRQYLKTDGITIFRSDDEQEKRYYVNGKVIYFHELNQAQKQRISAVEAKLDHLQQQFQIQEGKLEQFAAELEQKAQTITDEVSKLEQVSVKFDKDTINMQDLAVISAELSKLALIDEALIKQQEQEMAKIEQQFDAVDLSIIKEIEIQAAKLESVLIDIAKEL
ncbi:hypothetical protein [Thalassotalea sp. G2M2-11]|uniref:hypothetical protein n=1 Tax=Thalassotalea sp. G2M2-11 TaxID=2787627 RepID=UPI0019D304DC|nr:hypothetical protein [Thalassotalea sp. G2M2-11]